MQSLMIRKTFLTLALVAFFAVTGCTVKLIAPYDEAIDQGVTALQKKFETFLIGLEDNNSFPACSHRKNMSFYLESKVDLSAIKVRAAATPKNKITIEQLDLLASSLNSLEELHKLKDKKSKCIQAAEIGPLRVAFNSSFTAILKLELAKKRGEE